MKPYRVLIKSPVQSSDSSECTVMTAMLSVNDKGQRSIYITKRSSEMSGQFVLNAVRDDIAKRIAHEVCTKKNSTILATYKLKNFTTEDQEFMYKIYVSEGKNNVRSIDDAPLEYTQEDCLKACIEHFCKIHNLEIEKTL